MSLPPPAPAGRRAEIPIQGLMTDRRGAIVSSVDLRRDAARPRVLIIDDAEDNRNIYRFFLAHDGFDVEVAADGEAGVALAECRPFDVIVMDLTMPKMDGWEATRRLKADALTQAIPIIMLTGYPETPAKPDGPAAGWDAYLTKPCLPESLEAEIRRILSVPTA
jgi:two-component system cell cycle response regulator DivK